MAVTAAPRSILIEEEREQLESRDLDPADHRTLDLTVAYRVRQLAADPTSLDEQQVLADVCLLADNGHNGTVSLVYGRLGDQLPERDRT